VVFITFIYYKLIHGNIIIFNKTDADLLKIFDGDNFFFALKYTLAIIH